MSQQIQDAYIVAATRSPIGRAHKGYFAHTRPDDLLASVMQAALAQAPSLDPAAIEDVIAGCAIPEAQQGVGQLCASNGGSKRQRNNKAGHEVEQIN